MYFFIALKAHFSKWSQTPAIAQERVESEVEDTYRLPSKLEELFRPERTEFYLDDGM